MKTRFDMKRPVNLASCVLVLIIIVDVIFSVRVIGRQDSEIGALEARAAELRAALHGGRAGSRAGRSSRMGPDGEASGRVLADIAGFKRRFTDRRGLTGILEKVFASARRSGLKIPSGDYSPETVKETDISRYTISFPVEGGYSQIKRFIYEIETSKSGLVIEDMTLTGNRAPEGTIGMNIRISAYFL